MQFQIKVITRFCVYSFICYLVILIASISGETKLLVTAAVEEENNNPDEGFHAPSGEPAAAFGGISPPIKCGSGQLLNPNVLCRPSSPSSFPGRRRRSAF